MTFYLSDRFPKSAQVIRRREHNVAGFKEISTDEPFTVGATVRNAARQLIPLELDLRKNKIFRKKLKPGVKLK